MKKSEIIKKLNELAKGKTSDWLSKVTQREEDDEELEYIYKKE